MSQEKSEITLFHYLNSISFTKEDLSLTDPLFEKTYSEFMINRFLSMSPDTLFWVNELTKMSNLTKKLHYYFLLGSIDKKKRFFKYVKGTSATSKEINNIVTYYNVNVEVANEYLALLNKTQLKEINSLYETSVSGRKDKMK